MRGAAIMLFNSVSYFTFLLLAVTAYWSSPVKIRRSILLVASVLFYGSWRAEYVFLIVFSAGVDYFFSLQIFSAKSTTLRRAFLLMSLATNLGLLIYFKYTYFILDNVAMATGMPAATLRASVGDIILPLGISFYTFLSVSYTIDIYRGEFKPVRDFGLYLTYVLFWPHMIAGPILRAHELIPQLAAPCAQRAEEFVGGLKQILIGSFLKVFLANQVAPLVDAAFLTPPSQLGGLDVMTMAFGFGQEIYFDFAGYSMIAIGSARLVGVKFPDNFNWPYLAASPREFWRRWHITLSSWIRDYLYLPLSGLRQPSKSEGGLDIQFMPSRNSARATMALFSAWFIMGLWHGASWNFALWGLWHATFIFAYRKTNRYFAPLPALLRSVLGWATTLSVVMLGWIFVCCRHSGSPFSPRRVCGSRQRFSC
jgi:alginate O-acetyltransferase complex protein AlgI